MNTAYLLLGSNIGNREEYLKKAIELIETDDRRPTTDSFSHQTRITARSSIYITKAWGNTDQNDFLNQAIEVKTILSAEELLEKLLGIEKKLGRERKKKWEPREIDIDILFFDQQICISDHLHIPHPHLHERRFALLPLSEIAKDFIHPVFKKTVGQLLTECKDPLSAEIT